MALASNAFKCVPDDVSNTEKKSETPNLSINTLVEMECAIVLEWELAVLRVGVVDYCIRVLLLLL